MYDDKEYRIVKMLWLALLYGVVTASAASEMDEINAGIRARAAALRGQPAQELRLALVNGPIKGETVGEDGTAKNASSLSKPVAQCPIVAVSGDACTFADSRCAARKSGSQ